MVTLASHKSKLNRELNIALKLPEKWTYPWLTPPIVYRGFYSVRSVEYLRRWSSVTTRKILVAWWWKAKLMRIGKLRSGIVPTIRVILSLSIPISVIVHVRRPAVERPDFTRGSAQSQKSKVLLWSSLWSMYITFLRILN